MVYQKKDRGVVSSTCSRCGEEVAVGSKRRCFRPREPGNFEVSALRIAVEASNASITCDGMDYDRLISRLFWESPARKRGCETYVRSSTLSQGRVSKANLQNPHSLID